MSKTLLYVVFVLVIVGGALFFFLNNKSGEKPSPSANPPTSTPPPAVTTKNESDATLSEQPNQEKFKEYFTEIYLAKLPVGAEFNPFKIIKTKVFSAGEQFCTSINMKKQVPADTLSNAVYDVIAKQDVKPRMGTFPQAMGPGNSTGCEPLSQSVGKYEFKIYIGDVLVSVLPFEVK